MFRSSKLLDVDNQEKHVQHASVEQRTAKLSGHTTDLETMYHTMEPVKLDELDPFAIAIK